MVVLKKIRSATLMEALVATVLIVVVFVVASLIVNNVVRNTFAQNTHKVSSRLNELEYSINNGQLIMPYEEEYEGWEITIHKDTFEGGVVIGAMNDKGKKVVRKRIYAE